MNHPQQTEREAAELQAAYQEQRQAWRAFVRRILATPQPTSTETEAE